MKVYGILTVRVIGLLGMWYRPCRVNSRRLAALNCEKESAHGEGFPKIGMVASISVNRILISAASVSKAKNA